MCHKTRALCQTIWVVLAFISVADGYNKALLIKGWKNLIIHENKRYVQADSISQTTSNIQRCLRLCWLFSGCRSLTYSDNRKKCQLSFWERAENRLADDSQSVAVDMTEAALDKKYIYGCDKRPCTRNEICIPVNKPDLYRCIGLSSSSCSAPPSVPNSEAADNGLGSLTFICEQGHVTMGSEVVSTCNAVTGTWSHVDISCTYTDCGLPPSIQGTTSRFNATSFGARAEFTCYDGFTSTSGPFFQTSCQENGRWSDGPICTQVICGSPTAYTNGNVEVLSRPLVNPNPAMNPLTDADRDNLYVSFGGRVEHTCQVGYSSPDAPFISVCLQTGLWSSHSTFNCSVLDCGEPATMPHATASYDTTSYQSKVTYICDEGFQSSVMPMTFECASNGTWEGPDLQCTPVDCGSPPSVDNAQAEYNATTFGSEVNYTCQSPAHIQGFESPVRRCLENGQWSAENISCLTSVCGVPPEEDHAAVTLFQNQTSVFAVYECEDGYEAENNIRDCDEEYKLWTEPRVACLPVSCEQPPSIPNTQVSTTELTYLNSATYTCNPGFQLSSVRNTLVCTPPGSWSTEQITCDEITCSSPPEFPNTEITPGLAEDKEYGYLHNITYRCKTGFVLTSSDSTSLTCMENGWGTTTIVCENLECEEPPLIGNSSREIVTSGHSTIAVYRCNDGYQLKDPFVNNKTCNKGAWTREDVQCVLVDCGAPVTVVNADADVSAGTSFMSQVSYQCQKGFNLTSAGNVRFCQANGSWSEEKVTCLGVVCPAPQSEPFCTVSMTGTTYGAVATYKCFEGYVVVNTSNQITQWQKTCTEKGTWDSDPPDLSCVPLDCGEPPVLQNGSVDFMESTLSSSASYSCDDGFVMKGSKQKVCNESGLWSGDGDVECVREIPEHCQPPATVSGATFRPAVSDLEFYLVGQDVEYICDEGYSLNGTLNTTSCGPDLTWSSLMISCQPLDCGPAPAVRHGVNISVATTTGSEMNYECEQGRKPVKVPMTKTCTINQTWTDNWLECVEEFKAVCSDPPEEPNSSLEFTSLGEGGLVTYTCNVGYTHWFFEDKMCTEKGEWSADKVMCQPVDCGKPPDVLKATMTYVSTGYGSVVTYNCEEGSGFKSDRTSRTCQSSSTWSTEFVECIEDHEPSCPDISNTSGIVLNSTKIGGVAYVYCREGFIPSLTPQMSYVVLTCGSEEWHQETINECIMLSCPPPSSVEYAQYRFAGLNYGSRTLYECDPGFVHTGETERYCTSNAEWSNEVIECVPENAVFCPNLPEVHGTSVMFTSRLVGSSAHFECDASHQEVAGTKVSECQKSGKWSEVTLTCAPVDCGPPPGLAFSISHVRNTTLSQVALYECEPGFEPARPFRIQCLESKSWSTPDGSCTANTPTTTEETVSACDNPPDLSDAEVNFTSVSVGSVATYTCRAGYIPSPYGNLSRACTESGQWSTNNLQCKYAGDCANPPQIINATVTSISYNDEDLTFEAVYECIPGHMIRKATGGTTNKLVITGCSVKLPTYLVPRLPQACSPVDCGEPPDLSPSHNLFQTAQVNSMTYNSEAIYSCLPPFNVSETQATSRCLSNGSWSVPDHVCSGCDPHPSINDGTVVLQQRPDSPFATEAVVECDANFQLLGPSGNLTCTNQSLGRPVWEGLDKVMCARVKWENQSAMFIGQLHTEYSDYFTNIRTCITAVYVGPTGLRVAYIGATSKVEKWRVYYGDVGIVQSRGRALLRTRPANRVNMVSHSVYSYELVKNEIISVCLSGFVHNDTIGVHIDGEFAGTIYPTETKQVQQVIVGGHLLKKSLTIDMVYIK